MKKISLFIHEDVYSSSVASIIDLFAGANWCLRQSGRSPGFKLELVSEKANTIHLDVPAQFVCQRTIEEITQTDLITFRDSPERSGLPLRNIEPPSSG